MMKAIKHCPVLLFFTFLILLLLTGIGFCVYTSKLASFTLLNFYHPAWLDYFFSYYTLMGDGIITALAIVLLFFYKKKKTALILLTAYLSSGIVVQILKRIIIQPRPGLYFDQIGFHYEHFVRGIDTLHSGSFPSGHTASAFAMATVLVLCLKSRKISLLCLSMAVLAGYSRIYLAQHFLQDVIAGAITGSIFGLLSFYLIQQAKPFKLAGIYRKKQPVYIQAEPEYTQTEPEYKQTIR
ncbi:membrane-associated phospholipid phosphatase [Pedobacter cryoconitis]|uniref:phosphatase PAP2 family protein n=1 Tax=Pedobacter cryoconitis TaxID=188932 RepID=UPI0016151BAC|nr:phosphatase PAP2 family protein [Pedobacter cryoconitis]MBB6272134.1 membrane-associated phospholipid phosphatase [Pedobacter cryoconitis]